MKNRTIWSNLIYLSLFFGGKGGGGREEMSARFVTAKVSAALEVSSRQFFSEREIHIVGWRIL